MNCLYQKEYSLRATDFDKYNRIKPTAVLELFQDAAGQHAEELGVSFEELIKRSYLWVLTRIRFKILAHPKISQKVILKTWPLQPTRLCYRREYCIENEQGERLITASSEWVIMHSERRRFVTDANLYSFTDGFHTETMFEGRLSKVGDFEAEGTPRIIHTGFSDLDANNHVNNTKYPNYVLDAIVPAEDDVLETFQIDYRKEVLEGAHLHIYHTRNEQEILAKGLGEQGDVMFACSLQYKK